MRPALFDMSASALPTTLFPMIHVLTGPSLQLNEVQLLLVAFLPIDEDF